MIQEIGMILKMMVIIKNLLTIIANYFRRLHLYVDAYLEEYFPEYDKPTHFFEEEEYKNDYLTYPIVEDEKEPVKQYTPYDGPVSMTP